MFSKKLAELRAIDWRNWDRRKLGSAIVLVLGLVFVVCCSFGYMVFLW